MREEPTSQKATHVSILNHNRLGDIFIAISPAINSWAWFTIFLITIFMGVYWWRDPLGFFALVAGSVTTVAGFLTILLWLIMAAIGGVILNRLFLPFLRGIMEVIFSILGRFRPEPRVYEVNEHFALYSGDLRIHDHREEKNTYTYKMDGLPVPASAQALLPAPRDLDVPNARELLEDGRVQEVIGRGEIILGFLEDGQVKTLPYDLLYSTDLGGIGGSGKTTTAFWLCVQEIMAGTKLIVVDPHMHVTRRGKHEGLGHILAPYGFSFHFPPCDDTPADIMQRARWMRDENRRRSRPGIDVSTLPQVMMVIDEFNSVIEIEEIKEELGDIIAKVQREGRKLGLFFLLIGHRWSQQDIGNIKIRTNASTVMAHYYNDAGQAGKLIGSAQGKLCTELKRGSYWLKGLHTGDLCKIWTPAISEEDTPLILDLLGVRTEYPTDEMVINTVASTMTSAWRPDEISGRDMNQPGQPLDAKMPENALTLEMHTKMLMVLELDETGEKNQNDIISTVWRCEPDTRQGRAAKEELKAIRAYLAQQMRKNMKLT